LTTTTIETLSTGKLKEEKKIKEKKKKSSDTQHSFLYHSSYFILRAKTTIRNEIGGDRG
jgi:hypothetical protein